MKGKSIFLIIILALIAGLFSVYSTFQNKGSAHVERGADGTVIRILASYDVPDVQEGMEKLAEDYAAGHPGTEVEFLWIDREDLKKEICLNAENGTQQDLVICGNQEMEAFAGMEVLQEIPGGSRAEFLPGALRYPELWKTATTDGKVYGLPLTADPYVLFCNLDFMEENQSAPPGTWEDVLEVCREIDEPGISGIGFGVRRTGDAADVFDNLLYTLDGDYYRLSEEPGLAALELLDTLKRRGFIRKNLINYTPRDAAKDFAEARTAMLLAPLSLRGYIEEKKIFEKTGICSLPSGDAGYVLTGENLGVLEGARPEALDFVRYLYGEEARRALLQATGTLPLYEKDAKVSGENGELADLEEQLANACLVPDDYSNWFEISGTLAEYLYAVLVNKSVNLSEAAKSLQDEVRVAMMR